MKVSWTFLVLETCEISWDEIYQDKMNKVEIFQVEIFQDELSQVEIGWDIPRCEISRWDISE